MYSKVIFLCCLLSVVAAAPHTHDQSQNGDLNVQVDLKDLQIFAILNGQHDEYYEDIDYAYDYSEMTIKPQGGTSKPLNVTDSTTDNGTVATTMFEGTTEPSKNTSETTSSSPGLVNETATTEKSETVIPLTNITSESNTTSVPQFRKEDGVITTGKNDIETTTTTTNLSDPVTLKPQAFMSNISTVKSEVESTTNSVRTTGSNVTTKRIANSNCKKGFVANQRGGCDLKMQSMSNTLLKIVKLSQKLKSRRHRNGQDAL